MLFAPPPPVLMPIAGMADRWPVNRLFCVGRNYAAHAREMGMAGDRGTFMYFTKWASTVVGPGDVPMAPNTSNYHYEGELVLAIGAAGANLTPEQADALIWGYAAGLDMTRRDLQFAMRDKGLPWDIAKNVEAGAPLGLIHPRSATGPLTAGAITTHLNGARVQHGDLTDMLWGPAEIVALISQSYTLQPGDLIFTGTPEGVGPVVAGDQVVVAIDGLTSLAVRFV
jgi:fumarylpyruvate hydrolase